MTARATTILATALASAACFSARPKPARTINALPADKTATPAAPTAHGPAPELSLVPDDARSVMRWDGLGPSLALFRAKLDARPGFKPGCFEDLVAKVDSEIIIDLGDLDTMAHVFVGSFRRNDVEKCVQAVESAIVMPTEVHLDEETTRYDRTDPDGAIDVAWSGWFPGGAVAANESSTVDAVLHAPRSPAADAPLAVLWARTAGDLRVASTRDWTGKLLGVASQGLIASGSIAEFKKSKLFLVRVQYASDGDATLALAALDRLRQREGLPSEAVHAIESMRATRDGHELVLNFYGIADDTSLLGGLKWLVGL